MRNNKIFHSIYHKLFIIILFLLLGFIFINSYTHVNANTGTQDETKKICNARIDDNFTDDTILITLTKSKSLKFLDYSVDDFPNLELLSVTEMTEKISEKIEEDMIIGLH